MPQDVELGAGYCGDIMFQRFPGQYRNPEMDQNERQHFNSFPGNHGPAFTDPDHGRQMVAKDMPGIGLVMVPAEAARAQEQHQRNLAAVYPSDHTMVGVGDLGHDDPRTPHGRMHWHAQLVQALDASASIASAPAQLATAFSTVAQMVVQRALEKAQHGRFKTADDAVAFVKTAIVTAAKSFNPMVQKVAAMVAESTAKTSADALKKAWKAPKPGAKHKGHKHAAPGVSDWPGSMMGGMGGVADSIANLAAGSDLDEMARNISRLVDALVAAYNQVTLLKQQEAAAQANAPAGDGPPSPDDNQFVQYLSAMKAVNQGYQSLTGFDYMTQVLANVFAPNAAKLDSVYSGITAILGQIANWNATWQSQIGDSHPDMVQLWDSIQNEHNRLYAAATGGKPLNFDDPAYLDTASQAVQNMTGIDPSQASSGLSDFGISALIACIVIAIAAVAIAVAVVKVAGSFNTVANNIATQRQQYEKQMASQHDDYIAKRVSEGSDVQTAEQEWLQLKQQYDQQEAQKEADYGKNAPTMTDFTKYAAYAAAAVGGIVILPHLLKLFGL
jgi:KaiC/GvpD/RAD55 family RecA-like ATPase